MTDFVEIEAKVLSKAMKMATAIVERRCTIPILNTVRLRYGPKGLSIDATDLDIQASLAVDEIDGKGDWQTCISARDLASIASMAGVSPLRISPAATSSTDAKGNTREALTAMIVAGEATYQVQAFPACDFPEIAGDRMQRIERFSNGHLAAMLRKVSYCISTEETRYYLNGVNWSANSDGKRLVATDGHRLALCRYVANENDEKFSYIIPRKTVSILTQFMDAADIEIFSIGKGNEIRDTVLDFTAPGIALRTKLIDGTYPDVDRVIPRDESHRLDIRRDEMLTAIRQATAIGGWRGPAIRLHGINGRMNVEIKKPDTGTAKVTTSTAWPEGVAEIGVNSRYMTQMVKSCQGNITVGMNGAGAPITLLDDDKDMTRVVMPMRV